jgi:hypothetical protein
MPSRACEHCKLLMKLINKNYKHRVLGHEQLEFRASETPKGSRSETPIPCVARRTRMKGRKTNRFCVLPDLQSLSTQGHTGDA